MNIKEAEALSGVSRRNIRFYEQKGLLKPVRNRDNDYREYSEADVETLKLIRVLRMVDMPIEQIRNVVKEEIPLTVAVSAHRNKLKTKMKELETALRFCEELACSKELDIDGMLCRMDEPENQSRLFKGWEQDYLNAIFWTLARAGLGMVVPIMLIFTVPVIQPLWFAAPVAAQLMAFMLLLLWGLLGYGLGEFGSWWGNTLMVHLVPLLLFAVLRLAENSENPVVLIVRSFAQIYYWCIELSFEPLVGGSGIQAAWIIQPVLIILFAFGGMVRKWKELSYYKKKTGPAAD